MSQNPTNPNLSDMIAQLLSDPQKMQQFGQMASSLGLGTASQQGESSPSSSLLPSSPSSSAQNQQNSSSSPDLASMLQNLLSQTQPQNRTTSQPNSPSLDLSGLLSSLGNNSSVQNQQNPISGFDFSTLEKIQTAMQMFSQSNPNVDLLRAMRPLLSQRRAKKVDDAIRIMQLIQILPMLKESGLFGFGGEEQ